MIETLKLIGRSFWSLCKNCRYTNC